MISEYGYWTMNDKSQHGTDAGLAKALVKFFDKVDAISIYDFGCGDGFYTNYLYNEGFNIKGFDGNPHTPELTGGFCQVQNLAEPFEMKPREWVMSLEVAEHIPAQYQDIFIDNIVNHCKKGVIISWAVKGQGGYGHVNCKNNDEVIDLFTKKCFVLDKTNTDRLRDAVALYPTPCYWFRDTLLVFRKGS